MLNTKYQSPKVIYQQLRRSKALPDQAMSIETILSRFTRGIPVNVAKREEVFIDQDEYDFEKLSRMSFDQKFELAQTLKAKAEEIDRRLKEVTELEREQKEEFERSQKAQATGRAGSIDNDLDNTMLHDTTEKSGVSKQSKKGGVKNE